MRVNKFYEFIELPSSGTEYEKLANVYIKEYRNRFSDCMLHSRALETLEVLNKLSISQSILSAGEQKDVESFACFFNVKQWVQCIDGASNIEAKGKGDRVAAHISKLKLDPKDVLLIGDPCHDQEINSYIRIVKQGCGGLFGFFSSHAANSFGLATFFYLTLKNYSNLFKYLFLWALIVSYSRIYVGVHFPLDIFFGTTFGIIIGILTFKFYEKNLYSFKFFNKS